MIQSVGGMQKGFTKGEQNIAGGHHCVKNDSI